MNTSFNKFITTNYDILTNTGDNVLQSESFAMLYDLLYNENASLDANFSLNKNRKDRNSILMNKIINKMLYYCNKCNNFPCPYIIINGNVENKINSQHFLWCSNMFYQHYLITKDKLYYTKSKEIFEYVINNNIYKKSNLIINWINTKNYPFTDKSNTNIFSIKSFTKCGLFAIFDKLELLDKQLDFIQEKMYSEKKKIFYSYNQLETNTNIIGDSYLGNNLELAEGLYDTYKITKINKYKELADKIVNGCLKNFNKSDYILGLLQLYNILRVNKFPINNNLKNEFDKLTIKIKNEESLPSFKNNLDKNIFSEIYYYRCLLPIDN